MNANPTQSITLKRQPPKVKPDPFSIFPFIAERILKYLRKEEEGLIPPWSLILFNQRNKIQQFKFSEMPHPNQYCFMEIHNFLQELEFQLRYDGSSYEDSLNQSYLNAEMTVIDDVLILAKEMLIIASGLSSMYWGAHLHYYEAEDQAVYTGTFIKSLAVDSVVIEKKHGDYKRITVPSWRVFKAAQK